MDKPAVRCWIVDDDLSFGRSLQRMLKAGGVPAEFFGSAQAFVDSVPPGQSGIAVVNAGMPVCDGFGLLRKMRDLNYDMPVIMIAGEASGAVRDRAMQSGAAGFLQKPFTWESLLKLIRTLAPKTPAP